MNKMEGVMYLPDATEVSFRCEWVESSMRGPSVSMMERRKEEEVRQAWRGKIMEGLKCAEVAAFSSQLVELVCNSEDRDRVMT